MTRVSFFVHDLCNNPIVRAVPLAQALAGHFDVEILGFLHGDRDVYVPYRNLFEYRTLRCSLDMTRMLPALPRLAAMASGDVVYACKPLVPTLGVGLLASGFGRCRPLLLDVEDDERVPMGTSVGDVLWRDVLKGWRHATAWKYTLTTHALVGCAEAVTVSTSRLQARYGGTILRHGPDEHAFDPALCPVQAEARRAFNLPQDVPLALFAGMPQPHKGFDVLRRRSSTRAARTGTSPWQAPKDTRSSRPVRRCSDRGVTIWASCRSRGCRPCCPRSTWRRCRSCGSGSR